MRVTAQIYMLEYQHDHLPIIRKPFMVHLKSEKKIKEMEKSYNIHVKNYKKDNCCSNRNDRIRVKSIPLEWFSVMTS